MESGNNRVWIISGIVAIVAVGAFLVFIALRSGGSGTSQPAAETQIPPVAVAATCTSSDANLGSNAIYTKGTVSAVDSNGTAQSLVDNCGDGTHLIKYICYENPAGSGKYSSGRTIVNCPHGCLNGACNK